MRMQRPPQLIGGEVGRLVAGEHTLGFLRSRSASQAAVAEGVIAVVDTVFLGNGVTTSLSNDHASQARR